MDTANLKNVILPILEAKGLFLVDLKVSKDNVIEIFVDAPEGVNIQTCIEVSREMEARFDRDKEDFELTVASAGIGYPFKVEEQYRKNLNKTVEVKFKDQTRCTGVLLAFDRDRITLACEERQAVAGSRKKQPVKIEKIIPREAIGEIRDVVTF